MSTNSKIEWTETTWNPVTGCTKISSGCNNCYAERMALRLKAMGQQNYINGFNLTLHPEVLNKPKTWKKSKVIFVNSMSDLFHEDIPDSFILDVFSVMKHCNWHTFQVLTKRSERLLQLANKIQWPDNVWMGVTVESNNYINRINDLEQTRAYIKFISFEPLIAPITDFNFNNIDWVIVGGESGPKSRKMDEEWVLPIQKYCNTKNIPFFFKQWGGTNKKKAGRLLQNKTWDNMPLKKIV